MFQEIYRMLWDIYGIFPCCEKFMRKFPINFISHEHYTCDITFYGKWGPTIYGGVWAFYTSVAFCHANVNTAI